MSLDDTYEALQQFQTTLREFDNKLRVGQAVIRKCHEDIDGLWQDALRVQYDQLMKRFQQNVDSYASGRSEEFESFLDRKILQLHTYLHGD